MSIRDTSLWQQFIAGGELKKKDEIRDALCKALTDAHYIELVELSGSESLLDCEAAIRVLMQMRRRLSESQREQWAATLLGMVRTHYPRNSLGIVAMSALRSVAPDAAGRFVLTELDIDSVPEPDMRWVILDLQLNGTPAALARLEALAPRHEAARKVLEEQAGLSPSALEQLAEEWRATRRSDVLDRLYWKHITRLREGASAQELTTLLGEPTQRDGARYWYQAADSSYTLYLETDGRDRLVGWKLK